MHLKWTEPAEADLDYIEEYITEENSPLVAVDVVLKIIDTTELVLGEFPEGGRSGKVKGTLEKVVGGEPYIVVYSLEDNDEIHILRVLHETQKWPPA